MMINDPLSDMIARIKNAATRKRSKVLTPASRLRQRVLAVGREAHRTHGDRASRSARRAVEQHDVKDKFCTRAPGPRRL